MGEYRFEIEYGKGGPREHITVLTTRKHHYTDEKMRYILREYCVYNEDNTRDSVCMYQFVNEEEWNNILKLRVNE